MIAIVSLWALVLWGAITGSNQAPEIAFPKEVSATLLATMLAMPIVFFSLGSLWMRHSPFYHPFLAKAIDGRFGADALASFLVRLRPLLLFAVGAAIQGAIGLLKAHSSGNATSGAYAIHGFFLSGGIAFALAHFILYFRKVPGVYPTPTNQDLPVQRYESVAPERKSLRDALRSYWWCLIGLAVFPTVLMAGNNLFHLSFEVFILPFFAVGLLAGWPHFSGRAPYTFWLVACLVWLLGGFVGIAATQLLVMLIG